jgi:cell division protein FtsB
MSTRAAAPSPTAARKHSTGARKDVPARRTRMSGRAAILIIVVLAILTLAIAPFRAYTAQRTQIAELRRQAATYIHDNQVLTDKVANLSDPAELERIARECLGMVRPGETAFMTVPKHGTVTPPKC